MSQKGFLRHSSFNLTEKLSLACAILSAPYFFVFRYFGFYTAGNMIIVAIGLFLLPVLVSRLNFEEGAKFNLVLSASLVLFFYSIILGKSSGAYVVLISIVALPIVLSEGIGKKRVILQCLIPISAAYFLEYQNYHLFFHQNVLNMHQVKFIHAWALSTAFCFGIASSVLLMKQLHKKMAELKDKNATIQTHLEEMERVNNELKDKAAIDKELDMAKDIQKNILPHEPPPGRGYHLDHLFIPAKQVSGDYYDYFPFSATKMGIVVADIVGKGIPASLMMIAFKGLMHRIVSPNMSPSQTLAQLSDSIFLNTILGKYVPVIYGILDTKTHTFTYSNAGHEPGMLLAAGKAKELDIGGYPLGMFETQFYEEEVIQLGLNDRILLFTDGLTDIKSDTGNQLGIEALKIIMTAHAHTPDKQFKQTVRSQVLSYFEGQDQADDITLISVRRDPAAPKQ